MSNELRIYMSRLGRVVSGSKEEESLGTQIEAFKKHNDILKLNPHQLKIYQSLLDKYKATRNNVSRRLRTIKQEPPID